MFDDKPMNAQQILEIAQPEVEETAPVEVQPEQVEETPQQAPVESDAEKNFKRLRESKLRAERERDEAIRILREMEAQRAAQSQVDDEININPDDLVEGKHVKQLQKQLAKTQEEFRKQQEQVYQAQMEARIKQEYPDFDKVVSLDNIEALREQFPQIANTLHATTDIYSKAVSAYTMIKKLGIHVDDLYEREREVAKRNAAKPKPLASVSPQQGDSPLSKANAFANGLTDDLRKQLHKEMMEALKNR